MTAECIGDAKGERRIRKLEERCQHVTEQIQELREKKRLMKYEAWQIRAEQPGTNPIRRAVCRLIMKCYRW